MRLYARCLPEYFAMLGAEKRHEFRQIECIIVENTETKQTKEFLVSNILRLDSGRAELVKQNYPNVLWDAKLPVFAIELGEEVKIEPAAPIKAERHESEDDVRKYEFFNQRKKEEK